jgi:hypothetical protein
MQTYRHQELILKSVSKFNLNLQNRIILTEAATGNYRVTPVIAAVVGAEVYAICKDSLYGTVDEVKETTLELADSFNISDKIRFIESYNEVALDKVHILTNTGFNRPITSEIINQLSTKCVIPLMYEPWEFREADLDLKACEKHGIKVYGTNESDPRLGTMNYLGYIVMFHLLNEKLTPLSQVNILILGNDHFVDPTVKVLSKNGYDPTVVKDYTTLNKIDSTQYDVIVLMEHERDILLVGEGGFIEGNDISSKTILIHVCGSVDKESVPGKLIPKSPAPFGYMSFTTDFIDPNAVVDLHTAGLKVAEGMLKIAATKLAGSEYKLALENDYPALSFLDEKYY